MPNTYAAFYKNRNTEIRADTIYHAQLEAAKKLGARDHTKVAIMLVRRADNTEPIHVADF